MPIFDIAFRRPLAAILTVLGSFQGLFWIQFCNFFADAANSTNATFSGEMLVLGGAGPPFLHHVC